MKQDSAVALVAELLAQAVALEASDLYWLPGEDGAEVRVRRGGRQEHLAMVPGAVAEQALTHLKVRAGLLTYKTRVAQDGRLDVPGKDGPVAARVASMPTIAGERLTIRFQTATATARRLDELGLPATTLTSLRALLARENGLILLTGPTGSGKTTTIYAMIQDLLAGDCEPASIITVEDPVECRLPGVSQCAVRHEDEEWNYEHALRAALRQDVRTLVVGEIRDVRVARMVIDAALTGHRVISTFHGGDVAAVYARLLHLGFEPFLIGAAIAGVVAQRLCHGPGGAVPIAAVHVVDDSWRERLCTTPTLAELRRELQAIEGSDLTTVAAAAVASGTIDKTIAARIGSS